MTFTEPSAHVDTSFAVGSTPAHTPAKAPGKPGNTKQQRSKARVDKTMGPNSFTPRKSSPFFEHTLSLRSLMAQQLFQSTYGRTQVALYNVRFLGPMLADQKTAQELAATVHSMLSSIREELDETIGQLRVLRKQKGADEVAAFSDPEVTTVQWFTPSTKAFLLLVEQFDALMAEIETLWMFEHFDDEAKKTLGYEWRNRLIRFARQLIDLQTRSLEAVHRKMNKNNGASHKPAKNAQTPAPQAPTTQAVAQGAGDAVIDASTDGASVTHLDASVASHADAEASVRDAGHAAEALVDSALSEVESAAAPAPVLVAAPDVGVLLRENIAEKQDLDAVIAETGGATAIRRPRKAVTPVPPADVDVVPCAALG